MQNEVQIKLQNLPYPLRIYELGMARNKDFVYAYFQAPANQWGYYVQLFDKALDTFFVK
jgi:hypothetical protein